MPRAARRLSLIAACALSPLAVAAQPAPSPAPATAQPTPGAIPPATPAAPAPITDDGAKALQAKIDQALAGLGAAPADPLRASSAVTAQGDHYHVAVSMTGANAFPDGVQLSAEARPLEAGRWSLDGMRVPDNLPMRVVVPPTPKSPGGTLDGALSIGRQNTHGVIDPSLRTPSQVSSDWGDYQIALTGAPLRETIRLDAIKANASLTPAANGRVDGVQSGTATGLSGVVGVPGQDEVAFTAALFAVSMHLDGMQPARAASAYAALIRASAGRQQAAARRQAPAGQTSPPGAPPTAQPPDPDALRNLYLAVRGVATGGGLDEEVDNATLTASGKNFGLRKLDVGGAVTTTGGMLDGHLSLAIDGVSIPDLPPDFADLVPRHVAIQPSISAISTADLDTLILAATEPGKTPSDVAPLIAPLFSHGGIVAGIDRLELDVGPARLTGTGKLTATSPDALAGDAVVGMTGFDALADRINADPQLAAGGAVITMLRGLGRQDGERMVWRIGYHDHRLTVNGTDLTAIMASMSNRGGGQGDIPGADAPPMHHGQRRHGP